jgi:DNA invertase Pin-like site-specific DNA recombinase
VIAVIYARYSSELQSEKSIEDQVALCRQYAAREGFTIVGTYEDRAISGASVHGRRGLERMMRDAAGHQFTHLIVESLDRLSRDQADLATLYKRLTFIGIEIREVHGGKATALNTAVRGLIGAIYLTDLADKVRRGPAGVVREGRSPGGKAYGYAPVASKPGELAIVESEAAIVRRIFTEYAAGATPRAIAYRLNAEKVPPPRGSRWNASTINGSRSRGNGILGNELYAGILVWNKVRMVKNPDTGRRVSRINPDADWQRREAPGFRIVPEDLWQAAAIRRGERRKTRPEFQFVPRHPLSGLLKCHQCGSSLIVRDRDHGRVRIECTRRKESGTCDNRKIYYLDRLEEAIIGILKKEMTTPAAIVEYVTAYNEERRRAAARRVSSRDRMEARLAAVTGEIERTVTLMIKGLVVPERHALRLRELVPFHSECDWLICNHCKMGSCCGGTRSSMLRGTPG